MDYGEDIRRIEVPAQRDDGWFYHAFICSDETFRDMAVNGIKSRRALNRKVSFFESGHNGKHYISLSKLIPVSSERSAYINYGNCFSFIIKDINPIKCLKIGAPSVLANTILPIRFSATDDEYQMYKEILPDKYVGIRSLLLSWYLSNDVIQLTRLKNIIRILKEEGIEWPIFDYSRGMGSRVHVINQDEFMNISDGLIDSVSDPELKKVL